ncbi:multiple epidermal growth factor-like domains protein 10 [Mya arenaria]|uniref:multiple epidermal growth factor-like domains protein 10 n=1 Tax=Mya arenaria TaxID=6604 RepID=UPI0022E5A256|nr:multiple epidermal growth factor-like domains protein 10 [Mya arenaria]
MMIFQIFALLCVAQSCLAVTVIINEKEVDCSGNCACCEGGEAECGVGKGYTDYCVKGCVRTIFGHRCKNPCPGNCTTCEQDNGHPCLTCKDSYYDVNNDCSKSCPLGCDGPCNNDGTCITCISNFEGARCDACIQGKYGEDCSMNCHYQNCHCTEFNICDSCKTGFAGEFCMKCVAGKYGENCTISCPNLCKGGNCTSGGVCIECNTGYYGEQCNDMCSMGCSGGVCDKDGTCACTDNFTGTKCNKCVEDKYGDNCQHECSVGCFTLSCGKEDGSCYGGCKDGFYGMYCSQNCSDIDNECLKCNQLNGICSICNTGFYRNESGDCTTCNSNCNNGLCNHETGKCISGCAEGFWGDKCDVNCSSYCGTCQQGSGDCDSCKDPTVHGLYCNESCNSSCYENKCDQGNGHCSNGCNGDFFGNMCQFNCPVNCQQRGADTRCTADGICKYSCVDGYEGDDCSSKNMINVFPTTIRIYNKEQLLLEELVVAS